MKKVLLNSQNSVEKPPVHGSIVNPNYLVWGYIYGEITDQKDLQAALDKLQEAIDKGGSGSVVDVKQLDIPESEYLTTYYLTQGGYPVGININIPKDFLLKTVELKTVETNNEAYEGSGIGDKYIDFIINTRDNSVEDEHIYLPVKELMDIYSADETTLHLDTTTKTFSISKEYQKSINDSFDKLNADLKAETNRATQAESALTQSLETETSERKDADTKLSSRVKTIEDDYLTSADKTELQTNINAEVTRATTTEGNLNNLSTDSKDNLVNAINWEVSERESNVSTLTTSLQKEVDRATEAEDTLTKNLNTETTNRTNADTNLQSQLDTEVSTRKSADDTLTTNLNTEISNRQSAITSEKEAREKADAALEEKKADLDLVTGKYSLITETGNKIDLSIDSSTYELQAKLYDKNNNLISESTIVDLPIESSVVKIDFNKDTNTLTFTLRNGTVTEVPLSSIITGLATETYVDNKVQSEADLRSSADTTLTNNLDSEISRAKAAEALKEDKSNLKDFAYTNYGAGTVSSKTISGVKASGNVTGTASVTLKQTSTNATLTKSDYTPSGSITGTALSNTTLSDPVTELFAKSGIIVDVEDETLSFTIAPTGSALTKQGTLTNTQATLGFSGNKTSVVSGVTYDKASVNDATISIGQVSLDVGDIVVPSETITVSPGEDPIDASEVKY